jgi:hypothetical protein
MKKMLTEIKFKIIYINIIKNILYYILLIILIYIIYSILETLIIPDSNLNFALLTEEINNNNLNKNENIEKNKNLIFSLIKSTKDLILNNMGYISTKNNSINNHKILSVVHIFFEQKTGENQLQIFYNECKRNNHTFVITDISNKFNNNVILADQDILINQNNNTRNQDISINQNNYIIDIEEYYNEKKKLIDKLIENNNILEKEKLEELVSLLLNIFKDFNIVYNIILEILKNPEKYKMILNEMNNMFNYNDIEYNYKLNSFIKILNGQSAHYNFEREEDKANFVFTKSIYKKFYEQTKEYMSYKSFIVKDYNKPKEIIQYITPPLIDSYDQINSNNIKYNELNNYSYEKKTIEEIVNNIEVNEDKDKIIDYLMNKKASTIQDNIVKYYHNKEKIK